MGWYTSGPGDLEYKYGDVVLPPVPPVEKVGLLLVLLEELDIPDAQRERLDLVLRSVTPEVSQELRKLI
jgi:hypothetical protein